MMIKAIKKENMFSWKNLLLLLFSIVLFLIISELVFRLATIKPYGWWYKEHDLDWYMNTWNSEFSGHLKDYHAEKDDGVFRIAAVGDSLTYGLGWEGDVKIRQGETDNSYPHHLELFLNSQFDDYRYEVMNFGFYGSSQLEELVIIKRFVLGYHPDLVIIQTTDNDRISDVFNLDPFVYCGINFSVREKLLHAIFKNFRLFTHIYLKLLPTSHYIEKINPVDPIGERCLEMSFSNIKRLLDENHIPFFVFHFHTVSHRKGSGLEFRQYFDQQRIDWFNRTFDNISLDVLYLHPYLFNVSLDEVISDDELHYNIEGNRMVALIAYDYLVEKRIIPSCRVERCADKIVSII